MVFAHPNRGIGILLIGVSILMPMQGLAQSMGAGDGRFQAGDKIDIMVPGHPGLTMSLVLDDGGQVLIPQVGIVGISGLTTAEAEIVLRQHMRLLDPTLETVLVTRQSSQEQGMAFFLIGQVERPGQFVFTETPTVWQLFREAGGALDNANMRQVRLVREHDGKTQVEQFDLSEMLEGGDFPVITLLEGDTLVVPALLEGISSVPTATGVKVFGAVEVPTVVDIDQPTPLLDIIMLAGAPSADSEISKVQWVHHNGEIPQARVVNLREYLESGKPHGNPLVYPGDTVRVEYYQESWVRRTLPLVLGSLAAVATIWMAYDRIQDE